LFYIALNCCVLLYRNDEYFRYQNCLRAKNLQNKGLKTTEISFSFVIQIAKDTQSFPYPCDHQSCPSEDRTADIFIGGDLITFGHLRAKMSGRQI
jgi:hypothetical protein